METQCNSPLKRKNKTRAVWLRKGGLIATDEEKKLAKKAYNDRYRRENKDKINEHERTRRLKKRGAKKPTIIDWKDKNAVKEYKKAYYLKNKEKFVEYHREYLKKWVANLPIEKKEIRKSQLKKYRIDNSDAIKKANKKWRDKNGKEYNRQYREKNRAKIYERQKKHREKDYPVLNKRPYNKTEKWLKMHEEKSKTTFIGHLRNLEANKIESK